MRRDRPLGLIDVIITFCSLTDTWHTNMKTYRLVKTDFRYGMFHFITSFLREVLPPSPVLPVPSLPFPWKQLSRRQAHPKYRGNKEHHYTANNKEHHYTANCLYHKKENLLSLLWKWGGRYSSVGIATRYGLDGPGIESRWGRDFLHLSRPALGPTKPTIQWVPGLSRA